MPSASSNQPARPTRLPTAPRARDPHSLTPTPCADARPLLILWLGGRYRFDDERVSPLTTEQLERELRKAYGGRGSTSAYMLLYRERGDGSTPRPAPAAAGVPPSPQAGYTSSEETAVL